MSVIINTRIVIASRLGNVYTDFHLMLLYIHGFSTCAEFLEGVWLL